MNSCRVCELEGSRIFAACDYAVAIKDAFPVTPGQVLVIPPLDVNSIYGLADREVCI
jgi:diadenosine tetraphosphate (Ap4A) HIT family hydrolase